MIDIKKTKQAESADNSIPSGILLKGKKKNKKAKSKKVSYEDGEVSFAIENVDSDVNSTDGEGKVANEDGSEVLLTSLSEAEKKFLGIQDGSDEDGSDVVEELSDGSISGDGDDGDAALVKGEAVNGSALSGDDGGIFKYTGKKYTEVNYEYGKHSKDNDIRRTKLP